MTLRIKELIITVELLLSSIFHFCIWFQVQIFFKLFKIVYLYYKFKLVVVEERCNGELVWKIGVGRIVFTELISLETAWLPKAATAANEATEDAEWSDVIDVIDVDVGIKGLWELWELWWRPNEKPGIVKAGGNSGLEAIRIFSNSASFNLFSLALRFCDS
jgi:hypothetical protein